MPNGVLVLREAEIRDLLDPRAALPAIEAAFAAYSTGKADLPAVIQLNIPERQAEVHIKAGHLYGGAAFAVKVVGGFPENPARGLAASGGMVMAFDATTGAPAAFLLDNGWITDLRTGLAGAVAAKHLARADASVVAILGAGAQARHQVRSLALVRALREVRIWGRRPERARATAADLQGDAAIGKDVRVIAVESAEAAVAGADIVVTVTPSHEPILRAAWLVAGMHVTAVGSDQSEKQEVDAAALAAVDLLVADSTPQCLRLGEIHHAVAAGLIKESDIDADLGEIVAGKKPGRRDAQQITFCDLTGIGVQDVAAANVILERARAAGAGRTIDA